ncbi:MAG TPA: hypothetical protein VF045_10960 [Acidimicrobiales bacterium]
MPQRFPIRFSPLNRVLLTVLAAGPRNSYVEIGDDGQVRARMGFSFSATFPLASVTSCSRRGYVWWAIGVHGGGGRWIVNGTGREMVTIGIEPAVRARVLGFPVKLRDLWVSLEDPDGFCSAVGR